ncbi:MAG: hypothetical protein SWH68_01985 [Thermodesulfobacteriota bacterium]|nr:hypothetical protein [Thermodesulfobacteriota bacterium]
MMMSNPASQTTIPKTSYRSLVWVAGHFITLLLFQFIAMRRASFFPGQFSDFAYCYASINLALAFTLVGLHGALMRYLAIYAAQQDRNRCMTLIFQGLTIKMVLLLLAAIGLWLYLRLFGGGIDIQTIFWACFLLVAQGIFLLFQAIFRGLQRYEMVFIGALFLFVAYVVETDSLSELFCMITMGYLLSACVYGLALVIWNRKMSTGSSLPSFSPSNVVSWRELIRFSLLLSIGALFVLAFDNCPIILLKDVYSESTYQLLSFTFLLTLYPARLNAMGEALILPKMSTTLHSQGIIQAGEFFAKWEKRLHLISFMVVLPLVILIKPFIGYFFSQELSKASFFASILLLGQFSRLILPVMTSVFVAAGKPYLSTFSTGLKLAVDLIIIFLLRHHSPEVLIVALLFSWLLFGQLNYWLACKVLSKPRRPDWVPIIATTGGMVLLYMPFASLFMWMALGFVLIYVNDRKWRLDRNNLL